MGQGTVAWDFNGSSLGTNVCMNGDFKPELNDGKYSSENETLIHGLNGMEAVSLPCEDRSSQRIGEITLHITGKRAITFAPNIEAIMSYLKPPFDYNDHKRLGFGVSILPPKSKSWMDSKFVLRTVLSDGHQFCDCAIEIGKMVFDALGINDPNTYRLARFSITRESFVMIDGSWITFTRWMRIKHRLSVYGPEGGF
ncbi:hypothetical protein BH11PAT3_BH11PAT3_2560 [soil metagenome]